MERNVAVLPHRIRSHDDLRFRTSSVPRPRVPLRSQRPAYYTTVWEQVKGQKKLKKYTTRLRRGQGGVWNAKLETVYIYIYTPNHRVFSSGFNPCVGFADSYATDQITSQVGWTADACIS